MEISQIILNKKDVEEGISQELINIFLQSQYLDKKTPIMVDMVKH